MSILLARRGFLSGAFASLFAAPAIIRASSLEFGHLRGAPLLAPQTIDYTSEDSLNYQYWVNFGGSIRRMAARDILAAPKGAITPWLPERYGVASFFKNDPLSSFRPSNTYQSGLMFAHAPDGSLRIKNLAEKFDADPVLLRLRKEQEGLLVAVRAAKAEAERAAVAARQREKEEGYKRQAARYSSAERSSFAECDTRWTLNEIT